MHRVMQALLDTTMQVSKQGQPIALKLTTNKTTIIKCNKDYDKYYYKDYDHPLCMPARGKHAAIQYQVKDVKELMLVSRLAATAKSKSNPNPCNAKKLRFLVLSLEA